MERSITKTLAAALALQAAAFAALAVLAAVGALLDAGPGSDLKTLDSIAREVRFMESRAAIAELEQGSARGESARADIVQADARLREQLAREDFPAGRLVYSRDLRSGMAGLARGLEDGYQRLVQQTMGSSWTAGPVMDFITGSQEAGSRIEAASAGVAAARATVRGVIASCMVLAVLFGIGSLVPAFRALSRLRRNLTASSPLARSEPSVLKDLTAAFLKLSAAYKRLASGVARALLSVRNQTGLAEDINAEFSKIVRGAQKTSEGAAAGHGKTRSGGTSLSKTLEKMRRGVEEMRSLEGRAARIEEVIGLITDVADQTELISINAAIEAARAGEAGTGFNLVAQQVRKLADRSTRAASEISDLLGNVMVCVKKVSSSANESFAAVSAVQKEMTDVSAALNDFSDAASETASEAGRAGASLASLLTFARQSMSDAEAAAASNAVVEKVIREIEGITDRVAVVREPMAEPGSAGAPSGRISADGRQAAGEGDGAPGEEDVEELEAVEESETPER